MIDAPRNIEVTERPEIPWLGIVLGYGPMVPFAAGAALTWFAAGALRKDSVMLTIVWAAAILAFLAGVRRGLSFRTAGGPEWTQIVTMMGLFILALGAEVALVSGALTVAAACCAIGYFAIFVLDPIAARAGQVPLFFARLRRPQMTIALLNLAIMIWRLWIAPL